MIGSKLSCKLYKYTGGEFLVQAFLIILRNIQLQAPKSKNPSTNAGVFQFQMVARGGIDQGLGMANPSTILEYRCSDV